jgi:hypothetical protein
VKRILWPSAIAAGFMLLVIGWWHAVGPTATAAKPAAPTTPWSDEVNQFVIADHTIVDRYDDIPQQWIDEVKKMWLDVPGESHASGYRNGLELLQASDPRFQVSIREYGDPEPYTTQHLRASAATWGDVNNSSEWQYWYGEEDWFTSPLAVTRTRAHLTYANTNNLTVTAIAFAWCWDMTWHNAAGGGLDPVYQVHWAGSSEGGPDGDQRWGLDEGDMALTGNHVSMNTYLSATEAYIAHNAANGFGTWVFFTTGPVENIVYDIGEEGYQRQLKHEYIRNYVKNSNDRVLFDYADILTWGNDGTQNTQTWTDDGGTTRVFPFIHPDNMLDLNGTYVEDGDHIGQRGAVRLAKAMWWLLARQAGWDGVIGVHHASLGSGDWSAPGTWSGNAAPTSQDAITVTMGTTVTVDTNSQVQRLVVDQGATLIIPANVTLSVGDAVANRGTLRQTRAVNNSSISFLELGDASRGIVRSRGVEISSTHDLGNVTVSVRDLAPNDSCIASSSNYARRCFQISAQHDLTSTVRLWVPTRQLGDITQPRLYRYVAPNWVELDDNNAVGTVGGYTFVQADTPGFSYFAIGQDGNAPTAVTLTHLQVGLTSLERWWSVVGLITAATVLGSWLVRKHRLPK